MTAAYLPSRRTLPLLRAAVQSCKGCELYLRATQAVFGEGPRTARMALVGEQPGNEEDIQGHPFVGPAGGILDRALADASLERAEVYLTNAVKHFKFEERGKRRLHRKPRMGEVRACQPWLEAEMELIKPQVIVCLIDGNFQQLDSPLTLLKFSPLRIDERLRVAAVGALLKLTG